MRWSEYLLFRGFTHTLRQLDAEIKADKEKGFRVRAGERGAGRGGPEGARSWLSLSTALGAEAALSPRQESLTSARPALA